MSGFTGFTGAGRAEDKHPALHAMLGRIAHRGPDARGFYADEHMALAYCGADGGTNGEAAQNEDGTVVAVCDATLYNYKTLRSLLADKGHSFKTDAVGEALAHGYEEWGDDLPLKLRGPFSFAIWDTRRRALFFARDCFGIKPLCYALPRGDSLLFGSEIKAFLGHPAFEKALNPSALRAYLSFQYAAGSHTFWQGVHHLPPGHTARWDGNSLAATAYFEPHFKPDPGLSFDSCAQQIDAAVKESVAAQRVGGASACFLSGGVDSSYIAACLKPEKTYTVGFVREGDEAAGRFDETELAAQLSEKLGAVHYRRMLTAEECFAAFPDIQYHMDQPQSNPSSVPLWFLAGLAREHGALVFSGEGSDEIFAGYELYADTPAMLRYKRLPLGLRRAFGGAAGALPAFKGRNFLLKSAEKPQNWFIGQANVFSDRQALHVLREAYRHGPSALEMAAPYYARAAGLPEVNQKQYLDLHLWQPGDILVKADRMCGAHNLEARVPFLDSAVFAVAERVPVGFNIDGALTKKVFRHAASLSLPQEWATRPKRGFPVPIRHWLRQPRFYSLVKEYFTADFAGEFLIQKRIMPLLNAHFAGKANHGRQIWTLFTFLTWYKRFFVDEAGT